MLFRSISDGPTDGSTGARTNQQTKLFKESRARSSIIELPVPALILCWPEDRCLNKVLDIGFLLRSRTVDLWVYYCYIWTVRLNV